MKRIIALLLVLATLLTFFAACTDTEDESTSDEPNASDGGTQSATDAPTNNATEPLVYYTVTYKNAKNGTIEGELVQRIESGKSTTSVRAIANEGYVFAGWSDGESAFIRKESKVEKDITVYPKFIKVGTEFSIEYEVRTNGIIIQKEKLTAKAGESITFEPIEPTLGYKYGKWSDGKISAKRVDTVVSKDKTLTLDIVPLSLGVPTIEITTEDGLGIVDRENYKNCSVTVSNTEESDCFSGVNALLRGRGNSSWTYDKKGFRLKFDSKISMLGSGYKSKTWVFISNHGDPSLIRNMIAYDLSDRFGGLDYTVEHKYVDIYVDGEYYGLFMMTDKIDVGDGKLELDKTIDPDPSKTAFIIEVGASTAVDNYVKGVDYVALANDYDRGYYLNYPETDDPAYDPDVHLVYIENYLNDCLAALSEGNWDKICELMDVDSFVDHYIIQELFLNKDGFWRSVYFYKEPNGKLFAGPVWDLDQGAGNAVEFYASGKNECTPDCDIDYVNSEYRKSSGTPWIAGVNTWYRRIMRRSEFKQLLRERLTEYGPIIMEVLKNAETDASNPNSYYGKYSKAMERNFERWKILGVGTWPNSRVIRNITTVNGQIDYVRVWLTERYKVLCNHYGAEIRLE